MSASPAGFAGVLVHTHTCLNWGCIPTKTLIASSELLARINSAAAMGLRVDNASFDYAAMADRKDQVVSKLRNGVKQLLKANGITVYEGCASFESRNRIQVNTDRNGGEPVVLSAGKTIISTGATSAMPGFLPRHERIVESRGFLNLRKLPASTLILGGGVIGCEFACMLAQLGVRVTMVELLPDTGSASMRMCAASCAATWKKPWASAS